MYAVYGGHNEKEHAMNPTRLAAIAAARHTLSALLALLPGGDAALLAYELALFHHTE